ncbi:MAG TPA: hypothetical protein VF941_01005, partial [Clostridia bacterium]
MKYIKKLKLLLTVGLILIMQLQMWTGTFAQTTSDSGIQGGTPTLNSASASIPKSGIYKAIAAGGYHTVALKEDGTVVAWGNKSWDQCSVPKGLSGVKVIAAGENHTVALKE